MSLQFILGRAYTDKKHFLLEKMEKIVKQDKRAQIFYLVPDHIKFESEMGVLEHLKEKDDSVKNDYTGMIRLQVFSFNRLAWYFLQDTAIYNQAQLTETGLSMLVRKLLKENEEALTIYRGESNQMGFVEKLTNLFMEMRSGRVDPEDLKTILKSQKEDSDLSQVDFDQKIKDIQLLYASFMEELIGKYIEQEDILQALTNELKNQDLTNTSIIINNYESFSAQEQQLILELVKSTKDVFVSLTLNKKHALEPPALTDLFYEPAITYYRLYQQAREHNLPVLMDHILTEASGERCKELNHLENYWVKSTQLTQLGQNESMDMTNCMEVWEAESKQAEVLHSATKIRKLVASSNYRYKDILLVSRNMEEYQSLVEPIFNQNNIPYFVDESDSMAGHPLVECIQSLLLIYKRYYKYEDIMRFLRTELFIPLTDMTIIPKEREQRTSFWKEKAANWREKVDITENVALAYGYEGSDWTSNEEWIYARFHLEEMDQQLDSDKQMQAIANEVKEEFRSTLTPFFKRLNRVQTNRQAALQLYQFMEEICVHNQILFWRDQALQEGDLEESRKHEQVWQAFIQLLDEFVEVLGDEEWDLDSFLTILETGFEQEKYSIVPPSIDQVIFTSFDKLRSNTKKVVFILGLTDTQLPMNVENDSILSDEDRDRIQSNLSSNKFLGPSTDGLIAAEPFAAYMAFMNASEKLIFSYPIKNDGAGDNRISPYLRRISSHLNIPIDMKPAEVSALTQGEIEDVLSFIGSKRQTLGQLITVLREGIDSQLQPASFWTKLYKEMRDVEDPYQNRVFNSLEHKNIATPLSKNLATKLYGEDLYLSVSQLESFYLDPYSHFLQYGLRLQERAIQELTSAETGNFFHEALDVVFKTIAAQDLSLDELNDEMIHSITHDVLDDLYQEDKFRLLSTSNRMKFIRKQLGETVKRMVWALSNQMRRSRMSPQKSEVLFGRLGLEYGINGLSFPLQTGGNIHVRGKIDRLDTVELEDQLYLSIVDYKSSQQKLKFDEMYYGLMMQMLTYLDTATQQSEELLGRKAKPAGAFYSHVQNPYLTVEELEKSEWLDALLKKFRLSGLVVNEKELLTSLDRTMSEKTSSLVYPMNQLKSGAMRGNLIKEEELDLLIQYNRELIKEAGNRILSGENSMRPFDDKKQFTPAVGGEYRAISQFDVLLPENNYRPFEKMKKEKLIEKIKAQFELDEDEGEEDNR